MGAGGYRSLTMGTYVGAVSVAQCATRCRPKRSLRTLAIALNVRSNRRRHWRYRYQLRQATLRLLILQKSTSGGGEGSHTICWFCRICGTRVIINLCDRWKLSR
jgi:hypothetical protein